LYSAFGAVLVASIGSGIILGAIHAHRFSGVDVEEAYLRLQAFLATTAAVVSALSLITWSAASYLTVGAIPHLTVVLPLWLTMLWVGHITSFFSGRLVSSKRYAGAKCIRDVVA
jgi:hypothetical protein